MDIIQFIGFVIVMIASVILSFKRNREKKESLDIFEQFEEKQKKSAKRREEFEEAYEIEDEEEEDDEEEVEQKVLEKKYVVSDVTPPKLPSAPPVAIQKDFLKKYIAFDFHTEALAINKSTPKKEEFVFKIESLQNSIVIQEILNKPKGWWS